MKYQSAIGKNLVKKTIIIALIVFLITSFTSALLCINPIIPISTAVSENISWNATLRIREPGGSGMELVFGEATDASDDQDLYDKAAPPFQPQLPFIIAKFNTSMTFPYDSLLDEYKQYPDDYKKWYFFVIWQPEPGDDSSTTITISWEPTHLIKSNYTSVDLYKDNVSVSDMMNERNYTFNCSPSNLQQFQIICQKETGDINNTPFVPIYFIVIIIFLFTIYLKKKN